MRTLIFTDPNNLHSDFNALSIRVDLLNPAYDALTIMEITGDLEEAKRLGLDIVVPMSTSLSILKALSVISKLEMKSLEDDLVLTEQESD